MLNTDPLKVTVNLKLTFVCVLLAISGASMAQSDSLVQRRNTIKYLLLNGLVFPNAGALSYERVTKPNQSLAVTFGYVEFPKLGSFPSGIKVSDNNRHVGILVGFEYRYYLKKENKYLAPHGVFIGPYTNLFYFSNDRTITSSDGASEASLISKISAFNIGAQLGYQFVIANRWTVDLVFVGPSLSRYGAKMNLEGDFDEEELLENELVEALTDRFPLIKDLITEQDISVRGSRSTWAAGFRYQLNVGYHFGRKKKK